MDSGPEHRTRLSAASSGGASAAIPLWLKLAHTLFLCVLVPVYWRHYGPDNFLWASDIALFLVLATLWTGRPLFSSMMAISVLPFEILWTLDFLTGARLLGMAGYMFEPARPLYLRGLSLFHLALPPLLIFLLLRLGYDRRAWRAQTLLTWIVLPLTWATTDPADNINLAFGFSEEPQTRMHPLLHLALEMLLLPCIVYGPMHLLLRRLFGERPATALD